MQEPLSISTARIVGSYDPTTWSQAAVLKPFSYTEDNTLGDLFAVVFVRRNDDEDAAFFGKSLLDSLQNAYFAKQSEAKSDALKRALAQAEEVIGHEKDRLDAAAVMVCVLEDTKIYLGKVGDGTVSLFRANQLFSLIPKTKSAAVVTGQLLGNDYIILGTDSFFEHAYPTEALFNGENDAQEIADILSPLLLSLPENGDIAAFVVACLKKKTSLTPPPPMQVVSPEPPTTPQPLSIESQVAPESATAPLVIHPLEELANTATQTIAAGGIFPHFSKHIKQRLPMLYVLKDKKRFSDQASMIDMSHVTQSRPLINRQLLAKLLIIAAVVIATALLIFGFLQYRKHQQATQAASLFALAQQNISKAQTVIQTDPKQAQALIKAASDAATKAAKTDPKLAAPPGLLDQISQAQTTILAVTAVKDPETLVDLSLIKDGFHGDAINLTDNVLLALDSKTPTVLKLDSKQHDGSVASGGSHLPGFIAATGLSDAIYAVTQDGIVSINSQTGNATPVITKDTTWGTIGAIAGFNNNLYLLDSGKGQIWKYEGDGTKFGAPKNVVGAEDTNMLMGGQELVIDGAFWVVTPQEIILISQGIPSKYTVDALPSPLGSHLRLATTGDTQNLFILDRDNQRVVVATKDGRYITQLTSQAFKNVVDITLDAAAKQLYLLTPTKVLHVPVTL